MGLLDITSNVITKYQADASQQIRELEKLKAKISDAQKAELDSHKTREDTYQKWLTGITGVNQGLEIAAKVINVARDSFKAYADHVRLASAAGVANIERLKDAALGLRSEHELMTFAAQTQRGVVRANQEQMETAQKAMVALTRAGFDQEEVTKKITDAMVSLKVNGLDDFGITVQKGKTDLETYNNLMAELGKRASGVKEGHLTAAEGIRKTGVTMQESIEKMKIALGQLVQSLAPLLNALAKAVALVADLAQGHMEVSEAGGVQGYIMKRQGKSFDQFYKDKPRGGAGGVFGGSDETYLTGDDEFGRASAIFDVFDTMSGSMGQWDKWGRSPEEAVTNFLAKAKADYDKAKGASPKMKDLAAIGSYDLAEGMSKGDLSQFFGPELGEAAAINVDEQAILERISGPHLKAYEEIQNAATRYDDYLNTKTDSKLAKVFGPIDELALYKSAFQGLSNAVGGTYEAIITGAEPAGQAFKRLLADSLMSLGKESAIRALQELAYAAGSLAFGNVGGAALHAKAAAMHGAVAVIAGAAASQIGTSAQVTAAAKAEDEKKREEEKAKKEEEKKKKERDRGMRGGGEGGGDSDRPLVIVLGNHFDELSPRQRALTAEREIKKVTGGSGGRDE